MKDSFKITIPSHPKFLSIVRSITSKIGEIYGINETIVNDLKLAVDEACTNIIRHAYKGDTTKKIILKYKLSPIQITVILEDNGIKADINKLKGRNLDDIKPGGLGIHFIKRVFDVFMLDEKKKKGNRLILIKHLK
ncbi:MAG: ATP-binding protein [Nitrospirae bacterium]|nr:ATP-binding protein [Nitrospirota bacterium]